MSTAPAITAATLFDPIEQAIEEIAAGRPVIVADDADRENEGDIILAADHVTPELVGFMVRHTSGVICVPMTGGALDRLNLPPMTAVNQDRKGTAYTVSVDARTGITTGISAADRARTIRLLVDPATQPGDLTRPGHVFPLRAAADGVLRRRGHTEAAVDLARLAGLAPAGVLCELVNDDGSMMRLPQLHAFARKHRLALISIADLIDHRRRVERLIERIAQTRLPTRNGVFTAIGYRNRIDGVEHIALLAGDLGDGRDVLVRVHSECLTGEVFGSLRCDCGPQLAAAMEQVAEQGRGVVLYMRGHEGRGIGLLPKLRAYSLQDAGRDTVDANLELGLPADARDYGIAAQILADLGVRTVRLLTNNPAKRTALEAYGLPVADRVPIEMPPTSDNLRYLRTKRDRLGHLMDALDDGPLAAATVPTDSLGATAFPVDEA